MRSRPRTPACLRHLLSAGAAALLVASGFVAGCLNPQPDDFPQSNNDSAPNERAMAQAPVDVAETAPGAPNASGTTPAPVTPPLVDLGGKSPTLAPPAPEAPGDVPDDADAGAPADAGPPDAALVAQ